MPKTRAFWGRTIEKGRQEGRRSGPACPAAQNIGTLDRDKSEALAWAEKGIDALDTCPITPDPDAALNERLRRGVIN